MTGWIEAMMEGVIDCFKELSVCSNGQLSDWGEYSHFYALPLSGDGVKLKD